MAGQGWLMAPARFGQAFAPLLFALLIERFGSGALVVSAALGLFQRAQGVSGVRRCRPYAALATI